jgi:hypothetical protein
MIEEHFFADVNLPFHVWVRERSGARGFRWVLREAPLPKQSSQGSAAASRRDGQPGARGA